MPNTPRFHNITGDIHHPLAFERTADAIRDLANSGSDYPIGGSMFEDQIIDHPDDLILGKSNPIETAGASIQTIWFNDIGRMIASAARKSAETEVLGVLSFAYQHPDAEMHSDIWPLSRPYDVRELVVDVVISITGELDEEAQYAGFVAAHKVGQESLWNAAFQDRDASEHHFAGKADVWLGRSIALAASELRDRHTRP